MLRTNRPILAFFDSIKALRLRQLALILKAGYDPNLMVNAHGQNGLQFMVGYFGATEARYRLQAPINKSAYLGIAKLLLDSGLDPNAMDLLSDETILFDAIRYNDKEMVALLLNYVDLGLRNKNGETALMCAARFGSKQVVRLLLEHLRHLEMDCFFLRQRNRFGLTPLEIARTENLEAAKVLTKHLIAYGQHTGSVLARSVSHHQLAADYAYRPAVPVAAGRRRRHNAAELLAADECLSASDYDSDILALPPARMPARPGRRLAATAAYGPYYDPKAAEFSQYLLDQQVAQESGELAGYGPAGGAQRAAPSRAAMSAMSDDDEDYGPAGGPLVRSRSCMLGPRAVAGGGGGAAGAGHSKSGAFATRTAANKKAAEQSGAGEMAASWQERATGAAGPAQ